MSAEGLTVLLTNDDGVNAPPLDMLAVHLLREGFDVRVIAPSEEYTGAGAGIGHMSEGAFVASRVVALPESGLEAISLEGPPALCATAACHAAFGWTPDVVVSGTNSGYNTGRVVVHSGTLGAALAAGAMGVSAMALSTKRGAEHGFETAAEFAARTLRGFADGEPPGTVVNVNVPDLPTAGLRPARATSLAKQSIVSLTVRRVVDGIVLGRTILDEPIDDPASDVFAIDSGAISVTRVHGGVYGLDVQEEVSWMS